MLQPSQPKLFDLVEFRFDRTKGPKGKFVKHQTHKYNLPKGICYAEMRKIIFLVPPSRLTRFRVVPNGDLQYTNSFKKPKPLTNQTENGIQTASFQGQHGH